MKYLVILISSFILAFSTNAAPGPNLDRFQCESFSGYHRVEGVFKEECLDQRYKKWNARGCLTISVIKNNRLVLKQEFLRDFTARETQQGFYAFYDYDAQTWILNSMIIRLKASSDDLHEFRLDERGSSRDQMIVAARGYCSLKASQVI